MFAIGNKRVVACFKGAKQKLLIALSCLVLSGCSISFIYNNLDWWVGWYLDDYVDLTKEQEKAFDESFELLHLWHRKTQLTLYAEQLSELKQSVVAQTLTEADIEQHFTRVRSHWLTTATKVEPELARLTNMLDQEQRSEMVELIEEENQELRDDRKQLTLDERNKERAKDQSKQFKKWFGRLNKQQKQLIAERVTEFKSSYDDWLAYRDLWLVEFKQVLGPDILVDEYRRQFKALILDNDKLRSSEHIAKLDHNQGVFNKLFFDFTQTLTEKQKKTFNRKLDNLIEDLNELAQKD
ncbi:hypothetical protein J7384_09685 [Endozoicomonas sp. G2_1]|uniref:DUF6279 family lipoprotein n=1 Tax=Endozoicomonas sp. G2_1 TaxID=2821091 RepID=UPI001ADAAD93|nr:DUF6279 family lipoprotein [Endozoicomonas sp. G2_1]MBO9490633.1 hypothetical protein [Endozoicomonas sp. G2_1]